jgi:hypothetical protein
MKSDGPCKYILIGPFEKLPFERSTFEHDMMDDLKDLQNDQWAKTRVENKKKTIQLTTSSKDS